jgi:hypothetical protein
MNAQALLAMAKARNEVIQRDADASTELIISYYTRHDLTASKRLVAALESVLEYVGQYAEADCKRADGSTDGIMVGLRMAAGDIQRRVNAALVATRWSRDIPPLPWTDVTRLWFAGSIFAAAIAASAVVGIVSALRGWPETFTTDPSGEKPA